MRALVFDGTTPELQQRRPRPEPAKGEALVRTRKVAVDSLDLEVCRGMLEFRGVVGHQFVGLVEAVAGDGRQELLGKRVVGTITCYCGQCDMCLAGMSVHCRDRTLLGLQGRDGCMAEHFTIPTENLVCIDDSVDDDHAVFAEPLASAVQSARQLTIEGKPYITVLGDRALALLMVQVMSRLNASVRLVGWNEAHLSLCEKWGIKHRHADDIGRRADQDIVVDCTEARSSLELAMQLVRPRGTIVLKSLVAPTDTSGPRVDLNPIVLNEIQIVGSHRGPINEALALLTRREVDVLSLITRRMSLSDGVAVLKAAARPDVIRVLVEP